MNSVISIFYFFKKNDQTTYDYNQTTFDLFGLGYDKYKVFHDPPHSLLIFFLSVILNLNLTDMVAPARPQFVLFGSSIVQLSFGHSGWGSHLSDIYSRKVPSFNCIHLLSFLLPLNTAFFHCCSTLQLQHHHMHPCITSMLSYMSCHVVFSTSSMPLFFFFLTLFCGEAVTNSSI